jgi:hypothetical protein
MSIDSKHPDFVEVETDYRIMRDTFAGERKIKEATFAYLLPTAGQVMDGALKNASSPGAAAYANYVARSRFSDLVKQAMKTLVGVMVKEPAVIELPPELEGMRKKATRKGETLQALLRRIYEQQLQKGRFGLLVDFPQNPVAFDIDELPHFVEYIADNIINWDDERQTEFGSNVLNFAVFNETVQVRGRDEHDIFNWEEERRFRVAILEPVNPELEFSASNPMVYKTFTENDGDRSDTVTPMFKGVAAEEIPFTFIGSNDLDSAPDEIPLLGLANLAIHIYQSGADYYHALHVIGSDTLVIIGDEITKDGDTKDEAEPTRVGTGAVIRVAAGDGGDAKFIGVESDGIPEQRTAIQNDLVEAREHGARLLEPRKGQAESGEALRTRVASSTANLHQIALTGAAGLEKALKQAAVWIGANPDLVSVTPNLDFTQVHTEPRQLVDLTTAKRDGAPLSDESIHRWMQENNITRMSLEEEKEAIAKEPKKPEPVVPVVPVIPGAPVVPAEGEEETE